METKKYQSGAAVVAIHDGTKAVYESLNSLPPYQAKAKYSAEVMPGTRDYRTEISKMLQHKPEAIIIDLLPGDVGLFAHQTRELGYKGDFLGFNFTEGEETLTAASGALEGMVYTQAGNPREEFQNIYRERYETEPSYGTGHVYDGLMILEKTYKNSSERWIKNIESLRDYEGALGTYSATPSHEFTIPVILKTVRDNQFQPL